MEKDFQSTVTSALLPHNKEAEQGVLGSILHENTALANVARLLTVDSFFSSAHQHIFNAMLDLAENGSPLDELTISDELRRIGKLEQIGGVYYIQDLIQQVPRTANCEAYAKIVRQKHQLRSLVMMGDELANKGRMARDEVSALLATAEKSLLELAQNSHEKSHAPIGELTRECFTYLSEIEGSGRDLLGLPSGFIGLDKIVQGFKPGELTVIAARPSMGKTTFLMNILTHAISQSDTAGVLFSLEMSKQQLALRCLCATASVDSQIIFSGKSLNEDQWGALTAASQKIGSLNLHIDDNSMLNVTNIRAVLQQIKAEHRLGIIGVDYMQLMSSNHRTATREQEIAEISRGLKAIAKDFNIPVLACAQLNRYLEHRDDRRPILSDLRESGAIEQDADIVMFIYRDEVYNKETKDKNIAEIHVAKNRTGPITEDRKGIRLAFVKKFTRFTTLAKEPDNEIHN